MNDIVGITKICPQCGKYFSFSCREDEWGFGYGKRLFCTYSCQRAWVKKREGYRRAPIGMTEESRLERDRAVLELFLGGWSMGRIASHLAIGHNTVRDILHMHNISGDDVKDLRDTRIIKLRKSGKIIREIAADVGVSVNTVYNVLKAHGVEASA